MDNKTFSQLAKEQKDPFKALYYEILDRFNSHDYDMAVSSMSEGLKDIILRCKIQLEFEAELLKGAKEYINGLEAENEQEIISHEFNYIDEATRQIFSDNLKRKQMNDREIKEINARIIIAARMGAPISKISNGFHTFAHLFDCLDTFVVAMIKQMAVLEHRPTFGRYTTGDLWIRARLPTIQKAELSVCFLVGAKHERAIRRFAIYSDEEITMPDLDENITKLLTAFYVINDLL